MASELFELRPLEELVAIHDADRKPVKKGDRKEGVYPYYGASGITDYVDDFIFDGDYVLLSEDGDNLRTRNTPIAFMARGKFWVNNHAHILKGKNGNNTDFICYALQVADVNSYISGSTRPKITQRDMKNIPVYCPPLKEQKAIAHILGSLDDKIELNRQMNETLEAMAQALFKSWFVDFDPVIDNALAAGNAIPDELLERAEQRKGIKKKDNTEIQNLFPNEFELTEEMGWIPKGWQELQIKDIAKVVKGKSYKSSELAESQTALVTLKSFKRGGGYRLDGLKEYTGKYKEEQEVKAGDLVVAYTDVTQAADLIGKPAMVIDDIRYKHLVISLDVAVVRPEIDSQKYYLYGLAQTEAFQSHNYSHSTGTTVLHLSKNAVPNYYLCLPSENLLHGFTKIVEPLFTSVNNNIGEIRNLEKLRDTLLPKLMSGELHIADAAALIDEAI